MDMPAAAPFNFTSSRTPSNVVEATAVITQTLTPKGQNVQMVLPVAQTVQYQMGTTQAVGNQLASAFILNRCIAEIMDLRPANAPSGWTEQVTMRLKPIHEQCWATVEACQTIVTAYASTIRAVQSAFNVMMAAQAGEGKVPEDMLVFCRETLSEEFKKLSLACVVVQQAKEVSTAKMKELAEELLFKSAMGSSSVSGLQGLLKDLHLCTDELQKVNEELEQAEAAVESGNETMDRLDGQIKACRACIESLQGSTQEAQTQLDRIRQDYRNQAETYLKKGKEKKETTGWWFWKKKTTETVPVGSEEIKRISDNMDAVSNSVLGAIMSSTNQLQAAEEKIRAFEEQKAAVVKAVAKAKNTTALAERQKQLRAQLEDLNKQLNGHFSAVEEGFKQFGMRGSNLARLLWCLNKMPAVLLERGQSPLAIFADNCRAELAFVQKIVEGNTPPQYMLYTVPAMLETAKSTLAELSPIVGQIGNNEIVKQAQAAALEWVPGGAKPVD